MELQSSSIVKPLCLFLHMLPCTPLCTPSQQQKGQSDGLPTSLKKAHAVFLEVIMASFLGASLKQAGLIFHLWLAVQHIRGNGD